MWLTKPLKHKQCIVNSDVPKSLLSSQSDKPFESESSKVFSSRVMTLSSRVRVKSQELSSDF